MKVYRKVTISSNGEVLEEDSFEYSGPVDQCKGGALRAQREAASQARKSYKLQLAQQAEQKAQLEEMKRMQTEEELRKRLIGERSLQKKKMGVASTIVGGARDLGTPNISTKSLYS